MYTPALIIESATNDETSPYSPRTGDAHTRISFSRAGEVLGHAWPAPGGRYWFAKLVGDTEPCFPQDTRDQAIRAALLRS